MSNLSTQSKAGNLHAGHRKRVRDTFLKVGIDGLQQHQVLELLLFYVFPRIDTNELAHELILHFGSLKKVFDAPYEELLKAEGIGPQAAFLITMMPQLSRLYALLEDDRIEEFNIDEIGKFLLKQYIGRTVETVYAVFFDNKGRKITHSLISEGSISAVELNVNKIAKIALQNDAVLVVVAHNHPGGVALPSKQDIDSTKELQASLKAVGIRLYDHLIIAGHDYVSVAHSMKSGLYSTK